MSTPKIEELAKTLQTQQEVIEAKILFLECYGSERNFSTDWLAAIEPNGKMPDGISKGARESVLFFRQKIGV